MSRICQGADSPPSLDGRQAPVVDRDQIDMEMLARVIAAQIQACNGSLVRNASEVGDVELWRLAARKAGRVLGVPIRTGVAPDGSRVWAVDNS